MFHQPEGQRSPSGVLIARDFRDNLIIDRYDPVFADMRASKLKHLRSANSEDAVTWNVFRSIRQIAPTTWLPLLWSEAFPTLQAPDDTAAVVKLWVSVAPPLGLLVDGDEGHSEIDVVIEAATWVWFLEAKLGSDISSGTTTRPERDQVLRNLDVGSHYAGVRNFYFSLIIASEARSRVGVAKLQEYTNLEVPRQKLASLRPDQLRNLAAVGLLSWHQLASILAKAERSAQRDDERIYARRAYQWLEGKLGSR